MTSDSVSSAIIGEAGGLLSAGLNLATANYQRKQSVKASKDLMNYQNDLNIANWQRQNEYNSPSNEISRLRAAGINPDLFYAAGASGLSSATIPGASGSSGMQAGTSASFGQPTQQSMLLDSQKKLLDSQTAKNLADANQTNQLTPWVTESIKSNLALNEANAKVLNENVEKVRNETELLRWQTHITRNEFQILDAVKQSRISEELKRNGASETQSETIMKLFAQRYVAEMRLAVAQSYASYVNADANRQNAQTNAKQQQLDAIIRHGELSVKRLNYQLDKSMNAAGIHNMQLQNQWRDELNSVGAFGRAIHDVLSIPVNALGGFFH